MADVLSIVAITCAMQCLVMITADQGVFRADYPRGNYSRYLRNNPQGVVFRGNPVIPRSDVLNINASQETFIDANTQLSPGLLKEIMFYTNGMNTAPTPGMDKLRVQIWKPIGVAGDNEYELVWEHQERGLEIGPVGTLWRLIIDEERSVRLTGTELLGVTFESEVGLLSLEFTESGRTFFRNIAYSSSNPSEPMFPLVGNSYMFGRLHIPGILSIGAVIEEESVESAQRPQEGQGAGTAPVPSSDVMKVPLRHVIAFLQSLPAQQEYHGNEIKLRSAYLPSGAKKSWIDADTPLASGWLTQFWFFTHNMSQTDLHPDVFKMRLQIWRQQNNSDSFLYELRWEYRVNYLELNGNLGNAWRVQVRESESIWLENSDRVGITLESEMGIISFNYAYGRNMVFRRMRTEDDFPDVGNSYQFEPVSVPAVWSIGVVVKRGASPQAGEDSGTTRQPTTDPEETFILQRIPGGNYSSFVDKVRGTAVFAGNPVIPRDTAPPAGFRKSFIEVTQQLPAGLLREFLFYTQNFVGEMAPDRLEIRAQIWKQVAPSADDDSENRYNLLWEHRVNGTVAGDTGILWRLVVPESQSILLDGSEYLGFTSESHVGVISFQYSLSSIAKFRSVPVMSTGMPHFPGVGYTYIFGALPLPGTFSIGAIINTV